MFGSPNDMKRSNTPSLLDPYYRLRVKGMQRHNSGGEQFPLITHHKVRIMRNRVSGHIGRDTPGVSGCSAHDFASLKIHARRCHNRLLVKGCEYISRILFVFLVDFFLFFVFRGRCSTLWTLQSTFRGRCRTLWALECRVCGRRRTFCGP